MKLILSLAFTTGLLLAGATAASAMMAPPAPHSHAGGLIQVRDGCGHGYHQNRHGHCVETDDEDRGWDDHRRIATGATAGIIGATAIACATGSRSEPRFGGVLF